MKSSNESVTEEPIVFPSDGCDLLGILHLPASPRSIGLIMLPAGAQYRVGPHRQHVLIARALADQGITTLRYDSSGTADSTGPYRDFELGPDMDGAVRALLAKVPELRQVVLWGICGSASAVLMHKARSAAVSAVILVNPWIRTDQSRGRTYLKHYYLKRVFEVGFWKKLYSGRIDFRSAGTSLLRFTRSAMGVGPEPTPRQEGLTYGHESDIAPQRIEERMADGLESFAGRVLLIMSGNDLTAREFDEFTQSSKRWRKLLRRSAVDRRDLPGADHTFSEPRWRGQVIDWMVDWLAEIESVS